MNEAIITRGLVKKYGRHAALNGFTLAVPSGSITGAVLLMYNISSTPFIPSSNGWITAFITASALAPVYVALTDTVGVEHGDAVLHGDIIGAALFGDGLHIRDQFALCPGVLRPEGQCRLTGRLLLTGCGFGRWSFGRWGFTGCAFVGYAFRQQDAQHHAQRDRGKGHDAPDIHAFVLVFHVYRLLLKYYTTKERARQFSINERNMYAVEAEGTLCSNIFA